MIRSIDTYSSNNSSRNAGLVDPRVLLSSLRAESVTALLEERVDEAALVNRKVHRRTVTLRGLAFADGGGSIDRDSSSESGENSGELHD